VLVLLHGALHLHHHHGIDCSGRRNVKMGKRCFTLRAPKCRSRRELAWELKREDFTHEDTEHTEGEGNREWATGNGRKQKAQGTRAEAHEVRTTQDARRKTSRECVAVLSEVQGKWAKRRTCARRSVAEEKNSPRRHGDTEGSGKAHGTRHQAEWVLVGLVRVPFNAEGAEGAEARR
jgi:hypothetical protein